MKMNGTTNEIRPAVARALKSAIDVMNVTELPEVTTEKNPVLEHVATTDLRDVHDIYSHLGYGDCKTHILTFIFDVHKFIF